MEPMLQHAMHNFTEPQFNKYGIPERFGGHIIAGTFSTLVGLRWLFCAFKRYYLCMREAAIKGSMRRKFTSSYVYPSTWFPGLPVEAAVLTLFAFGLVFMEIQNAIGHPTDEHHLAQNYMHICLFSLLGIPPIIAIFRHFRYPVLPGMEYLTGAVGNALMSMLLVQHTLHQNAMNKQAHLHQVMLWMTTAVVFIGEMLNMDKPIFPVFRGFMYCLTGSFTAQMDFILWPLHGKPWPAEDHFYLFMETMTLTWHFFAQLVVTGVISFIALVFVKRLTPSQVTKELDISLGGGAKGIYADEESIEGRYCLLKYCDDY
ncbi:transmembrane protein 45B [Hyalella azteca]|uniref:Transmembrane protein 45B n=1 Tax=Hyalella azteca TaxID=294128 RepID=A0A8B7PC88_HYAAZ|nr:transmembrane protein 45B [Hyalella azteca]